MGIYVNICLFSAVVSSPITSPPLSEANSIYLCYMSNCIRIYFFVAECLYKGHIQHLIDEAVHCLNLCDQKKNFVYFEKRVSCFILVSRYSLLS